jgi:hypothetical protein
MTTSIPSINNPDVLLVSAGTMSVTLGVILKELDPSLEIDLIWISSAPSIRKIYCRCWCRQG